jgi:hypothetical protein
MGVIDVLPEDGRAVAAADIAQKLEVEVNLLGMLPTFDSQSMVMQF